MGVYPVPSGWPHWGPELLLQRWPGHLQSATFWKGSSRPATEEGEVTFIHKGYVIWLVKLCFKLCPPCSVDKNKMFLLQGKEVSQESVKRFYKNWMSRQNTLSSLEDPEDIVPPVSSPPPVPSSARGYSKLKHTHSKISWGSSLSRSALM